jgi:hypothetical protein
MNMLFIKGKTILNFSYCPSLSKDIFGNSFPGLKELTTSKYKSNSSRLFGEYQKTDIPGWK